jgi:cytochrome c oxidase subunit 4
MADSSASQHHPSIRTYLMVAAVLAVITAVEIAVFYITALARYLAPTLIVSSIAKFALVVMFFMHLRFDARIFRWLFVGPLMLTIAVVLALMALFWTSP